MNIKAKPISQQLLEEKKNFASLPVLLHSFIIW